MKIIILAGGGGTRLWPVSRIRAPKQVKPFLDGETLLRKTFKRFLKASKKEDIFIATNIAYKTIVQSELPESPKSNFLFEPEKRDNAAAIGLAALRLFKKNPKEIVLFASSDAYIKDEPEFIKTLKIGERVAKKFPRRAVLIGVKPSYPETGYGYIKVGKSVPRSVILNEADRGEESRGRPKADPRRIPRIVISFVEKPSQRDAQRFVKSKRYLWNPMLFIFYVDHLLELYKKYLPKTYRILMTIEKSLGTKREWDVIKREYSKMQKISIDYGILQKTKDILVVTGNFKWADVGHWRSIQNILSERDSENIIQGMHIGVDTKGSLIYSFTKRLIATGGIKDLIIIDTEDALLVCSKKSAQGVKKLVKKLEQKKLYEYL